MQRAMGEAIRLGHRSAGTPHIVLALLDEHRPSVAREVLLENGLDRERVEASAARQHTGPQGEGTPRGGVTSAPLWHETAGRTEGFAATLGQGADDPEHVLLALLWQPRHRWFADLLTAAGTSRETIAAGLATRGVPLPRRPPQTGPHR